MPLILPGNVASATADAGYNVANSCMFNDDDSAYMHITPGSAGNRQKFTFSCWLKKCSGATEEIFIAATNTTNYTRIGFEAGDEIKIFEVASGSTAWEIQTQQKFRDFGAWYNIVVAFDTTQGTAANRIKLYVNGTRVPASSGFGDETYPDEDYETQVTNSVKHWIGISADGSNGPYDGYMAEVVLINDAQLTPTSFGEFNEDSPTIWQPINVSGLTFGTNGFYLDFEDSANLGNDANGGTDLTEVNLAATDQATDTPTNNFAVGNSINSRIAARYSGLTFSEGNLKLQTTAGTYPGLESTIGMTAGKWYAEFKATDAANWTLVGVVGGQATANDEYIGKASDSYGFAGGTAAGSSNSKVNNSTFASYAATYADGDIIGVALDLDNLAIYFSKNGTWEDSGDPESGGTKTGAAYTVTAVSNTRAGAYFFACGNYSGSDTPDWEANFGNPPYANSSSVADANGYGAFEYAVPSGYLALCTKNLGSTGG